MILLYSTQGVSDRDYTTLVQRLGYVLKLDLGASKLDTPQVQPQTQRVKGRS